jgi:hypothetical protein
MFCFQPIEDKMLTYENCGSRSEFYVIDRKKKIGFKTFDSKQSALEAIETQEFLSKFDLAPRVYSKVKRRRYNNKITGWGFDTEIAKVIGCGGNCCGCDECTHLYDKYNPKIDQLVSDIENYGYDFYDAHLGNVGFVYRNRKKILVCIDTGYESVGNGSSYSDCSCSACRS